MPVHIPSPAAFLRKTTFFCVVSSFSFRNLQWHQRGLLVMKIKNLVILQVLKSHSTPLVDSQELHQKKSYTDIFMDGDSSSGDLPPPPHPFPILF
ncbi:hypothetical protein E2C01_029230 [Portunus trituberculatus]|uniref:Uncharacterized protein n=1 Tax=Portunus trituberculatus TaxID=210409 RepID=A0A5B7EQX5_PORTR|nr:hypothetical protein [Portunus trituberculatus]